MTKVTKLWGCYACKKVFAESRSGSRAGRTNLPLCPDCNSSAVTRQLDWLIDRDRTVSSNRSGSMVLLDFSNEVRTPD